MPYLEPHGRSSRSIAERLLRPRYRSQVFRSDQTFQVQRLRSARGLFHLSRAERIARMVQHPSAEGVVSTTRLIVAIQHACTHRRPTRFLERGLQHARDVRHHLALCIYAPDLRVECSPRRYSDQTDLLECLRKASRMAHSGTRLARDARSDGTRAVDHGTRACRGRADLSTRVFFRPSSLVAKGLAATLFFISPGIELSQIGM